jgi:hypothetical protein
MRVARFTYSKEVNNIKREAMTRSILGAHVWRLNRMPVYCTYARRWPTLPSAACVGDVHQSRKQSHVHQSRKQSNVLVPHTPIFGQTATSPHKRGKGQSNRCSSQAADKNHRAEADGVL